MGMNPRTLRPSSTFTPKSISGLALWLDASQSGDLYTTDAGPVVPVNEPTEISGCVGWYDASDASSITKDGSNLVSQWNDKSGNNRHATASGSLRPTHGGSQNGRTVMQFTGTQAMSITGNFLQSDNVTMFAVAMKNTDHYGGIISSAPTNPEDSPILCFYLTTIAFLNRRVLVQQATGNNVYRIVSGQSVGTSQQGWFDGVRGTDATASVATNTSNTITKIGALRTGSTADLNGNIAEIVCYSGNLSPADRARVEAYLAAKWGISGVHAPATATSDPVGYWRDRSGNGRHATQSTAASRPTISANTQGGKKMLGFDGANGRLTISFPVTAADPVSMIAVARRGATTWGGGGGGGYGSFLNSTGGSSGGPQLRVDTGNIEVIGGTNKSTTLGSNVGVGSCAIIEGMVSSVATSLYVQGALVDSDAGAGSITTTGTRTSIGAWNDGTQGGGPLNGDIAELICYRASLSTSQRQKLERYLASKWGITLAPQVSNADAQDWINRVYANGGTVSASAAAAVNTFCNDIEAASIRDRFYRLNLFCGTGLNACLVPLYRGPSLGGTQYGNTTDTNVGPFVSGDYVETGASGGLNNASRTKYLNTGFPTNTVPAGDRHLAFYERTFVNADYDEFMGSESAASLSQQFALGRQASASTVAFRFGAATSAVQSGAASAGAFWLGVHGSSTGGVIYKNGASDGTGTLTAATPTTSEMHIFGINRASTPANVDRYGGTSGGYSIGLGMTAAQAAAFYTAMQAFQTALGRNV